MSKDRMWETEDGLKKVAAMCRSAVPVKAAVERLSNVADTDRRVEYMSGEKLVNMLLGECNAASTDKKKPAKKKKQLFEAKDVEEAHLVCQSLLREGYMHQAKRTGRGRLEFVPQLGQKWDPTGKYVWDFEGSKRLANFMSGMLIFGMIACTCFPIWPVVVKVYVWYCAVTFLIVLTVFVIVRFIAFINFWLIGYDFWIIPNFFDESLTVVDSFKPLYSFEGSPPGQRYYRAALLMASVAFFAWAYNQPTDFDIFVSVQKEFVADLYEGKLLADFSQQGKDDIDKIQRPSFDRLMAEEEEERKAREAREKLEKLHQATVNKVREEDVLDDDDEEAADDMIERMLNGEDDEDE